MKNSVKGKKIDGELKMMKNLRELRNFMRGWRNNF